MNAEARTEHRRLSSHSACERRDSGAIERAQQSTHQPVGETVSSSERIDCRTTGHLALVLHALLHAPPCRRRSVLGSPHRARPISQTTLNMVRRRMTDSSTPQPSQSGEMDLPQSSAASPPAASLTAKRCTSILFMRCCYTMLLYKTPQILSTLIRPFLS